MAAAPPSTTFKGSQAQPPKTAGTPRGTTGASNLWFASKKIKVGKEKIRTKKLIKKQPNVLESFSLEGIKYSLIKESENKYYVETSNIFDMSKFKRTEIKTQPMTKNQAIIKFNNLKTKNKIQFKLN